MYLQGIYLCGTSPIEVVWSTHMLSIADVKTEDLAGVRLDKAVWDFKEEFDIEGNRLNEHFKSPTHKGRAKGKGKGGGGKWEA